MSANVNKRLAVAENGITVVILRRY